MKKLGIAFLGLALLVMAALPNKAKAFSVNNTDLYLIVSGGSTSEYYLDLGSVSSILSGGGTWSFSNTVAGTGWSVIGDTAYLTGSGTVIFASQSPNASTLNNVAGGISMITVDSGFSGFAGGNTGSGNSVVNPLSNPDTFAANLAGTLNGGIPIQNGSIATSAVQSLLNGLTNAMNIYAGDYVTDNTVVFSNMVATVKSLGSGNFQLTIAAVPLPPSLVLFISGLIALGLIARRRQVGF